MASPLFFYMPAEDIAVKATIDFLKEIFIKEVFGLVKDRITKTQRKDNSPRQETSSIYCLFSNDG